MVAVVAVVEGVGVGGVGPVGAVTHKRLVVEKAYQIVLGAEIIKKLLNRDMVFRNKHAIWTSYYTCLPMDTLNSQIV